MAYKVIILYQLYMPSYFLGTFTEYPCLTFNFSAKNSNRCFTYFFLLLNITVHSARTFVESCRISL